VLAAGSVHVPAGGCSILGVQRHHINDDDYIVDYHCTDDNCPRDHVYVFTRDELDWSDVDNLVIISNHIVIGRAVYDNFAAVYDPPA
jgi:hypothetical protein